MYVAETAGWNGCRLRTHRQLFGQLTPSARLAVPPIDTYSFPRSPIVTSLLYVVPEADAKQMVAAPTKAKWKLAEMGKFLSKRNFR
jgi:hypothetical protein